MPTCIDVLFYKSYQKNDVWFIFFPKKRRMIYFFPKKTKIVGPQRNYGNEEGHLNNRGVVQTVAAIKWDSQKQGTTD